MNKHILSTIVLVFLLVGIVLFISISAITSSDVDELCANSNSIIYRDGSEWSCLGLDEITLTIGGGNSSVVDWTNINVPLINFTRYDARLVMYGNNSLLGGSPSSEGIQFIQTRPEGKAGVYWNAYDLDSNSVRPVAWLVAHFNSSSGGGDHQHFSIETLDNTTGTPSLNSHFTITYNSSQTRAVVGFPSSDVEFIGNQKLYFGDSQNAYVMQNGSSGDLELKTNADILLRATQFDMNGLDIVNIDDIFATGSIDVKPTTNFRVFPNSQTSISANFDVAGDGINLTIGGGTQFRIKANELLQLEANTTGVTCSSSSAGSLYYNKDTLKHYGCNGTTWNALY